VEIGGRDMKMIVIQGPTASGKTSLAVSLAKQLNTEIISADSRQFYREMSIGTAKPNREEQEGIVHHFIDSHTLLDEVTAARFSREARTVLANIASRKEFVVVVGGSGMFVDALLNGLDELPVDKEVKKKWQSVYDAQGLEELQRVFAEKDPIGTSIIDYNNPMRLLRALEIMELTQKPWSAQRTGKNSPLAFPVYRFAMDWSRPILYERINQRVNDMMQQGLLDEVERLLTFRNLKPLDTVGYKELFQYLDGHISLENAVTLIQQHTRNYAKRQLTWLRRYQDLTWLNPDGNPLENVLQLIDSTIKRPHG
jgi:tRNA dimethylallyltransferase